MSVQATRVLLIEDDPDDALLLEDRLRENHQFKTEVVLATTLAEGKQMATSHVFDAALLDLNLPDSRGIDTLVSWLRQVIEFPVVVLSGLEDEEVAIQAVRTGAQDYLIKGQETAQILERVLRYAIERDKSQRDTQRRLLQLRALHKIDNAISSTMPIDQVIDTFLKISLSQLSVDAATIYLLDEEHQALRLAWAIGLGQTADIGDVLPQADPFADLCVQQRHLIHSLDLKQENVAEPFGQLIEEEDLVFYACAPLLAKEQVKGVMALFHRQSIQPDAEWYDFFQTLAGQAAIAIQDAVMISNLRDATAELEIAYEATLSGWVRALDLRDHETEGHTQRVTDLSIRLATSLGVDDEELVHVRRGALLHDVGKIGVPDGILSKPGPLTDEEWVKMKKHPEYALDLLQGVDYLRPALDIPHYHHEKWDGSGYPDGLKGQAIPSAARLFAVVDVFDALTSDRPYRKAWTVKKALEHLQSEKGTHFDPVIADAFLQMMEAKSA